MADSSAVTRLLSWCSERDFWIDPRIQVISGPCGVAVISQDTTIPAESILARIPRESVLSVKSSPISELIPPHPYGRGAQLSLALALSVELMRGAASPWFPYLKSLPREIPGIPLFWTSGAHCGDPTEWLNGTEAWKMLFESEENHASLFSEIDEYFHQVVQQVYSQVFESSSPAMVPSLHHFYYAYSLVSSRAFLVDSYHGLSMVPIADAFNHAQENHVHLESDFDVCPECGSLPRCLHDDTGDSVSRATAVPDDADDFYEMVSNLPIPPNTEVYNTYGGTLSNAELLVQYGFILDVNENDRLIWTFAELAQFSENYLPPSWTWDSVGGLSQFRALLDALISGPWESISASELVHRDRMHAFCLNGDATVSHGLWLYFALLLCLRNTTSPANRDPNAVIVLLEDMIQRQLTLELLHTNSASGLDISVPQLPDDPSPYSDMLELACLLASLCRARSASTGKPGVEMTELGDILDRLPNDMNSTRMAISLAMTERSLLDSCMSSWEGLAECLELA
ncbi:hypothetical protein DFH07DRAFT_839274 [Mycena maculata]|uniref:SET domain-containing protein n=1 Tax=Mycena maculata TaxID=230809 RepID=A0AAD7ICZ1_9AGAR|nr:hypothetical protein DFH07DRAFT_839274 [Mycena maculata]